MKQKNKKLDLVTKDFFKKELKKELQQFGKKFDQKLTVLEVRTGIKLDALEKRVDDNAQKCRDQVLTSNDKLAKQLETMREENAIGFNQLNKQLGNHAKRIQGIERIQQTA